MVLYKHLHIFYVLFQANCWISVFSKNTTSSGVIAGYLAQEKGIRARAGCSWLSKFA